jgi:hypothetical protein
MLPWNVDRRRRRRCTTPPQASEPEAEGQTAPVMLRNFFSFQFVHDKVRLLLFSLLVVALLPDAAYSGADFIDTDTPLDKRTTTSLVDGTVYHLVGASRSFCGLLLESFWVRCSVTYVNSRLFCWEL